MPVTQISAVIADGNELIVFGLGADGLVYCWNTSKGEWELYSFKERPV